MLLKVVPRHEIIKKINCLPMLQLWWVPKFEAGICFCFRSPLVIQNILHKTGPPSIGGASTGLAVSSFVRSHHHHHLQMLHPPVAPCLLHPRRQLHLDWEQWLQWMVQCCYRSTGLEDQAAQFLRMTEQHKKNRPSCSGQVSFNSCLLSFVSMPATIKQIWQSW